MSLMLSIVEVDDVMVDTVHLHYHLLLQLFNID